MRTSAALLLTVGILVLALPSAQATSLNEEDNKLYIHISGTTFWINSDPADPAHTTASAGYNPLGFVLTGETGAALWTISANPPLTAPVTFGAGGKVAFSLQIGGCITGDSGQVSVSVSLYNGPTKVAEGAGQTATYTPTANTITLTWSVDPLVGGLDPALGALQWRVRAAGIGTEICLKSSTANPSYITLPIVGGLSAVPESFLATSPSPAATTTPGGTASFEVVITNNGTEEASYSGSVLGVPDGFNVTVDPPNGTVAAAETATLTVTAAVPTDAPEGAVALSLYVEGPNGGNATITLSLLVEATPSTSDPTADPTDVTDPTGDGSGDPNATQASGNETGGAQSGDGGGVPSASVWMVLTTGLSALVILARRRKQP